MRHVSTCFSVLLFSVAAGAQEYPLPLKDWRLPFEQGRQALTDTGPVRVVTASLGIETEDRTRRPIGMGWSRTSGDAEEPALSAPTKIVQLRQPALRRVCPNAKQRFTGCTRFVGPNLSARCVAGDEVWSMRTTARYEAQVYIDEGNLPAHGNLRYHEILHVRDVKNAVTLHLRQLENSTFDDRQTCVEAAETAVADFPIRLREFARESQHQRK